METALLHRKEGIIISTIEAINEVGIQNLSTKIIAKREGVSEGTLFRHFKNKTDILIAVLEHFRQYDNDIIQTSINKKLDPIESIEYFICVYSEYYENYPAITAILQNYDSLLCDLELSSIVKNIISKRKKFICQAVEEAQEQKIIISNVSSEVLTDIILGGAMEICLRWRMDKYSFSLKDRAMTMVKAVLDAFSDNS